jgi:hypothetical protein
MIRLGAASKKSIQLVAVGLGALLCIWAVVATARWGMQFQASTTLPNEMMLSRSFDFTRDGRDDLVSSDGQSTLARNVEFVCFNDRYVWVQSSGNLFSGVYDAESSAKISDDYHKAEAVRELRNNNECNGYYTGFVGPALLYDGNDEPFLPSCAWRNTANQALTQADWLARPCTQDSE